MTMLYKMAGVVLALYALIVLAAWLGQRRLMYAPDPTRYAPASVGLTDVTERELLTPDGARLVLWHLPPRPDAPTLLYFHGNAGGLASRADRFKRYRATGFGLTMLSYRGYSGSTGQPTEANNLADAALVFDMLVKDGVAPADIVLYGESLGSGVAVQLAAARPAAGVILDAPYSSMLDMAARTYPFLPVRPLLADRYESIRHITRITAPILVLHGAEDELIPVAMGRALHAAASLPKELVIFPNGRHTDLDQHGAVETVVRWVRALRPGKS
ncbi:MAG: alpha/beta hydrolase [Hyphomicrobiaceae bacterium]